MILSEDRLTHLAHIVVDGIWNDDLVDYPDEDTAIKIAKKAIRTYVEESEVIDEKVRGKIQSLKKQIFEGTTEWEIMYKKYYAEELNRRG